VVGVVVAAALASVGGASGTAAGGILSALGGAFSSALALGIGAAIGAFLVYYVLVDWQNLTGWVGAHPLSLPEISYPGRIFLTVPMSLITGAVLREISVLEVVVEALDVEMAALSQHPQHRFHLGALRRDHRGRKGGVQLGVGDGLDPSSQDLERLAVSDPAESPDAAYDRRWFLDQLDAAAADLKRRLTEAGKTAYFEVFRILVLDADSEVPSYQAVADRLGLRDSDVRNYLHHCRDAYREILRRRIRETVASDAEVEQEIGDLLRL